MMRILIFSISFLIGFYSLGQEKDDILAYNSLNKELLKELESYQVIYDTSKTSSAEEIKIFQKELDKSLKRFLKKFKKKKKFIFKIKKKYGSESEIVSEAFLCFEDHYAQDYVLEAHDQIMTSNYDEFDVWKSESETSFNSAINRLKQQISCIESGLK